MKRFLLALASAAALVAPAYAWPDKPVALVVPFPPGGSHVPYKGDVYSWQAVAAPKGLPADVKAKLHAALVAALNDPAVKPKLTEWGFEIVADTPEQFSAFQASEFARWKKVIEVGKISAD